MMSFSLKATAVAAAMIAAVAVLAATTTVEAAGAGSFNIPTPASPGFLLSPVFLWVAANVIVLWLLASSSSGRRGREGANDAGEVVLGAVDCFYASSSEYDDAAFSDAPAAVSKRPQAQEARAAAARRSDRPRVRKKPERDERRRVRGQEETAPAAVSVAAASADAAVVNNDDEDVTMESLWASIVQRRAAQPVMVQQGTT